MEGSNSDPPEIKYVFTNHGRTVARLAEVNHGLAWEDGGLQIYPPQDRRPLVTIAAGQSSEPFSCKFDGAFTFGDARAIVTKKKTLLFFGNAYFVDAFTQPRGIRWQYRCSGGDFESIHYQEYDPKVPDYN